MFSDKEKDRKGQDYFLSLSLAKNTLYGIVKELLRNVYPCCCIPAVPAGTVFTASGSIGNITVTDCASLVTDAIIHATGGRFPGTISTTDCLSVSFMYS
jgi:hypothetical protein